MMPQFTPTYWFSARWQMRASSIGATLLPARCIQEIAKASSTEAEELRPAPRGTSEAYAARMPSTGQARLA